jgi:hypothetical protein
MRQETRPAADRPRIEQRSIDFIPPEERYGSDRALFTLWFGGNLQVTSIAAGAVTVTLGLSLPWALVAIVAGQVSVPVISLPERVVIALPRPVHRQRLRADEAVAGRVGPLVRLRPHDLAGQHPALMIHHHRDLLVLAQVHRQHRPVPPDCLPKHHQLPVPVTPRQTTTLSHERPPAVAGSRSPSSHQGDVPSATTRSQQVVTTQGEPKRPWRPGKTSGNAGAGP